MSRRVRQARGFVVLMVAFAIGFAVLPSRLWVRQQSDLEQATAQLQELKRQSKALKQRVAELSRPDIVERQASGSLGLVHPYDELYAVGPEPAPKVQLPATWPFNKVQVALQQAATNH